LAILAGLPKLKRKALTNFKINYWTMKKLVLFLSIILFSFQAFSQEYYEIRSGSLGSKTSAQWIEIFERIDIPCMRYNSLEDLLEDPHIQSVNFLQQSNHPTEGLIREIGLTNKFSGGNRQGFTPAPRLGENTIEILQEFGVSEEKIEQALSNRSIVQQIHST
jgi:crotonobetainyl-CoA:carnitine CoA-transferase CaiB-like acyl-CoA transferase